MRRIACACHAPVRQPFGASFPACDSASLWASLCSSWRRCALVLSRAARRTSAQHGATPAARDVRRAEGRPCSAAQQHLTANAAVHATYPSICGSLPHGQNRHVPEPPSRRHKARTAFAFKAQHRSLAIPLRGLEHGLPHVVLGFNPRAVAEPERHPIAMGVYEAARPPGSVAHKGQAASGPG